jgi:hypothetical protein
LQSPRTHAACLRSRNPLPAFAETDRVLEYHLILVRATFDGFGIADPTAFAAKLQKTG